MKELKLSQGKVAIVDDDDFEWLNHWKWHYIKVVNHNTGYACRHFGNKATGKVILMHREIMHTPKDKQVDHIDHDGLNNQKYNLRNCTHKENGCNRLKSKNNTSGYNCVYLQGPKWRARIKVDGVTLNLGCYVTKEDAARAYDRAAKKYFGEFSHLNLE